MFSGPVDLPFQVGQTVMYPGRGEAKVDTIEDVDVLGTKLRTYVFALKDGGTIRVPLNKVHSSGVRAIGTVGNLQEVITCLKNRSERKGGMWIRRADGFQKDLMSGDIGRVAEVVRDLYHAPDDFAAVSMSERELYERALYLLLSEVSQIRSCSMTEAAGYLSKETGKIFQYRESLLNPTAKLSLAPMRKTGRKPEPLPGDAEILPAEPKTPKVETPKVAQRPRLAVDNSKERSNVVGPKKPGPKPRAKDTPKPRVVTGPNTETARLNSLLNMVTQQRDSLSAQNERWQEENRMLRTETDLLRKNLATAQSTVEEQARSIRELEGKLAEREAAMQLPAPKPDPEPKPEATAQKPKRRTHHEEPPVESSMQLQEDGFYWNPAWGEQE